MGKPLNCDLYKRQIENQSWSECVSLVPSHVKAWLLGNKLTQMRYRTEPPQPGAVPERPHTWSGRAAAHPQPASGFEQYLVLWWCKERESKWKALQSHCGPLFLALLAYLHVTVTVMVPESSLLWRTTFPCISWQVGMGHLSLKPTYQYAYSRGLSSHPFSLIFLENILSLRKVPERVSVFWQSRRRGEIDAMHCKSPKTTTLTYDNLFSFLKVTCARNAVASVCF